MSDGPWRKLLGFGTGLYGSVTVTNSPAAGRTRPREPETPGLRGEPDETAAAQPEKPSGLLEVTYFCAAQPSVAHFVAISHLVLGAFSRFLGRVEAEF